jgi:hypothetical protein
MRKLKLICVANTEKEVSNINMFEDR